MQKIGEIWLLQSFENSFLLHFLKDETFCPSFCQKAFAAKAEGKKASVLGLQSTPAKYQFFSIAQGSK